MRLQMFFVAVMLALGISACNGSFQFQQDQNFNYLTVNLPEADVVRTFQTILTSGDSRLRNVQADLRANEIFVSAEAPAANGTWIPGNLTFRAWAENGNLQLAVTSFNFGQITTQQAGIDNFNRQLAEGLSRSAARNQNQSEITEISITDSAFTFTIRTPRQRQ